MKIEKINDRQIRCTLTQEDLTNRHIRLSELAYGSEKAKALFQDMMQMAAQDFGFEADNMPLVIEAIPVSRDSIILIITKVEDPEELDTRFARFSPEEEEPDGEFSFSDFKDKIEGADDVLGLIRRISEAKKLAASKSGSTAPASNPPAAPDSTPEDEDEELMNLTRLYLFHSLDEVIQAAGVLGTLYDGPNSLYKNQENGQFYLIIKKAASPAAQFNKVCNILSEYAIACKSTPGTEAHFAEHLESIIPERALQKLLLLR